jgi:murein DD-endopeptidase MepM/ murein hydrolase activator NlpD
VFVLPVWDIACFSGSPVYAILDGSVESTQDSPGGYGKSVVLKVSYRGSTYYILYAHLMRIDVQKGQAVKEAERLGLSGQTGNAVGQAPAEAHLHFEVRTRPGGGAIDPGRLFGYQPVVETIMSDVRNAMRR